MLAPITREDLEELGVPFDTSLPQSYWDEIHEATGQNPYGNIVWAYPDKSVWGYPVPVTDQGAMMLQASDWPMVNSLRERIDSGTLEIARA